MDIKRFALSQFLQQQKYLFLNDGKIKVFVSPIQYI